MPVEDDQGWVQFNGWLHQSWSSPIEILSVVQCLITKIIRGHPESITNAKYHERGLWVHQPLLYNNLSEWEQQGVFRRHWHPTDFKSRSLARQDCLVVHSRLRFVGDEASYKPVWELPGGLVIGSLNGGIWLLKQIGEIPKLIFQVSVMSFWRRLTWLSM